MSLSLSRIDKSLHLHFNPRAFEKRTVAESHEVAALIDDEISKEILKELPAVGPVTYLSKLGVLISSVEQDGFEYLAQKRGVFGIADAEARCEMPEPLIDEEMKSHSSRDMMRGISPMFSSFEGKGITVGVVDSGIDSSHPEFTGRCHTQVNCVGDSLTGDVSGHGTHVAASIAGESVGVANQAEILDLRVFGVNDGASISSILMALDQCITRNVDVVNLSLGSEAPSYVLENAVDQVASEGIIVCAAAGNSGPHSETINCPSSAKLAISVAATDVSKNVTRFSSRGPCRWNSWQKPDCAGFGDYVYSAKNGGGYTTMSGTSMASPGIAGIAACLLEAQGETADGPSFVDWLLRNAGEPLNQQTEEVGTGYVSLEEIEKYVGNNKEMTKMAEKKKGTTLGRKFYSELVKCKSCKSQRSIHQIRHRNNGDMVFELSCRNCRAPPVDGKIDSEDIILEEWQHKRILNQDIIKSLRRCGKCGKEGLVVTEGWNVLKVKSGSRPHSEGKVGCLYCQTKGRRIIPTRISEIWND